MKSIKKLLIITLVVFAFMFTANVSAKEKVKVYVFEAVGCPFCTQQIDTLKELSKTNPNFEIVVKELYKSNATWEPGPAYDLGVKVADAFKAKGYPDSTYQATPLMIFGNKYAAASYNSNLEVLGALINAAYENEEEDVVACYENNGTNCESKILDLSGDIKKAEQDKKDADKITRAFLGLVILGGAAMFLYKVSEKKKN